MNPRNFFAELKRRHVYKVSVAYTVVAWLLIQAASIILPTFEAPAWTMKALIAVLAIGFPLAVVLAWAFEITPEGIVRAEDVPPNESITRRTGRKLTAVIVVVAVIAAGMFAFQFFKPASSSTVKNVGPTAPASAASAPGPATPEKSIAVLPFENLSEDKANAFFASGIQDEILTRLAKIGALKVISRTSTQQYQSKPQSLTEIAKQLGVANILEGSVQKAGNEVHINVQLIKAATDAHLWAESYDRELKNIFGVEGEVAGAIAEALNAKLTGAEEKALAVKPTNNVAAHDAYLRGRSIETTRDSFPGYQEAAADYVEAVRLDPDFALAWARQAITRSVLYFNGIDQNMNSPAAIKEAADQALALQPELGEAWTAQGVYRYRVLRDFTGALGALEEARKRLPNSADVFVVMAYIERRLGRWDAAEAHYRQAMQLDPRNFTIPISMGAEFLGPLRRYAEAQAVLDRALQIAPGNESALAAKANVYQVEGRLDEAAKELRQIRPDSDNDLAMYTRTPRALQLIYERRFDEAITQLQAATASPESGKPLSGPQKGLLPALGYCQEWAGRTGDARVTFGRAIQAIKPSQASIVPVDDTGLLCALALAHAGIGDKEKALDEARRAVADYQDDALGKPQAEIVLAIIEARFGDVDAAIGALAHLLEAPNGVTRAILRLDPNWDPLRKDPRFQKLIADEAVRTQTKP